MKKYETTYQHAFQPKYSSNYQHSRRQSARYSDAARNNDQLHLLFYNENMAPSKYIKHHRKSSGVQTGDAGGVGQSSMYDPGSYYNDYSVNYGGMNSMAAWPYPPSAQQFQQVYASGQYGMGQPAPNPRAPSPPPPLTVPTPYLIIDQSPIPGVQTGSPGLQVPAVGFEIPFHANTPQPYPPPPAGSQARYSPMMCPSQYLGDQYVPPPSSPTSLYYAR